MAGEILYILILVITVIAALALVLFGIYKFIMWLDTNEELTLEDINGSQGP